MDLDICHPHNLIETRDLSEANHRFGIRVSLPPGDTLRRLLGDDWERLHWYASLAERDVAYEHMAIRHGYYRNTDAPTQLLEKIVR